MSLKKYLLYALTYPLFVLSHFLPKDRRLLVFGSWRGTSYNDNSRYLFEYVNTKEKSYRAIWLSNSRETVEKVTSLGYEAYEMYSLRGMITAIRAGYAFLSRAKSEDLPIFLSPRKTRIIQLWHGTPLKKLGRDSLATIEERQSVRARILNWLRMSIFPHSGNRCHAFISSSNEVSRILESAYGDTIGDGGIVVSGYPRNDALFRTMTGRYNHKRGIYMPTFRDRVRDASNLFYRYGFSFGDMESFLAGMNTVLDIKLHPESLLPGEMAEKIKASGWMRLIDDADIYPLLGGYDFLITDYSSIFFDYLLLDRPIIFAPFDYEDYLSSRGIYFDYNEITPGTKAYNWQEVMNAIRVAVEDPGIGHSERTRVNMIVNDYTDDRNSWRVFQAVVASNER